MRYNRLTDEWENVGNPIICENVVVADGAKILGPILIGKNTVVAAGAIITKDVPVNSIAYGVNQFRIKDANYDFVFSPIMINIEKIIEANTKLITRFKNK
jgi:serine O-acetyltransferase